jgi:hypothetical protein
MVFVAALFSKVPQMGEQMTMVLIILIELIGISLAGWGFYRFFRSFRKK